MHFLAPERELENVDLVALQKYGAYEANAARNYYEELMQKAAEENGRAKVEVFLGKTVKKIHSLPT